MSEILSASATAERGAPGLSAEPAATAWHALDPTEATLRQGTSGDGLLPEEAALRLERHGPNALPEAPGRTLLQRLVSQLDSVLIYVLLGSAAVTAFLGETLDTVVILAVIALNAGIGLIQEGRAERALEAIRAMIAPTATVLRAGRRTTLSAADIVPGDLLILEAGDRVTADVRLLQARSLRIDEAVLTGESAPVDKSTEAAPEDAALADRCSMAYSGTLVTAGQGTGVVVATGRDTEIGRITTLMTRTTAMTTPLVAKMNRFASLLTGVILALCAATVTFAILVRGYPPAEAFMAAVGMAVAAIPEGLPAVITITLAIGVERMARRQAVIRRLPAVETLGAVTVICTDKTGTLTKNEMTVRQAAVSGAVYAVTGEGYAPSGDIVHDGNGTPPGATPLLTELARAAALCNDARLEQRGTDWHPLGDPMEAALTSFALKAGADPATLARELPRRDVIPFDAAHRFMATLHEPRGGGPAVVLVKGAPEKLLAMCRSERTATGEAPLDAEAWHERIEAFGREGQRTLLLATRTLPAGTREIDFPDVEQGLCLIGAVALIDPPRPEAITAISEVQAAGIAVKLITGDHAATAAAIARQLGLADAEHVLTGDALTRIPPGELGGRIAGTGVFARTSPEQKLILVETLQASGGVIAMTGDGINDAPALKRADVGVAMGGKGTEAAKEAAAMVLADDNFASIAAAVAEGRTVYDNLTKVIGWTLPTSFGVTAVIMVAIFAGLGLPVTPLQALWINMVTAVCLGLVLAFERSEPDIMSRPPRPPSEPILSRTLVWQIAFVSALFTLGAFAMYFSAVARGASEDLARTIVVNTLVVMEIFYLFSVRALRAGTFTLEGVKGTPAVLTGLGATILLQLAFTYLPPMQALFATAPLSLTDGVLVIAVGVALYVIVETEKLVRNRHIGRPAQ